MLSLEDLLYPGPVEQFASCYPTDYLFVRGEASKFSTLLSWETLASCLARTAFPHPDITLLIDSQRRVPDTLDELIDGWRSGRSFVIRNIDTMLPRVAAASAEWGRQLSAGITANLYASRSHQQGLRAHFDGHDVFVLQLAGSKRWHIFPPTVAFPLRYLPEDEGTQPARESLLEDITLEPGDLLYLPRGYWHDVLAETDSLHLTIGIHPSTGLTFLRWVVGELEACPELRAPPLLAARQRLGRLEELDPQLLAYYRDAAQRVSDTLRHDVDRWITSFLRSEILNLRQPASLAPPRLQTPDVSDTARLARCPGAVIWADQGDTGPTLRAFGRSIPVTETLLGAVREALESEELSVESLYRSVASRDTGMDEVRSLVKELLDAGVLTFKAPGNPAAGAPGPDLPK